MNNVVMALLMVIGILNILMWGGLLVALIVVYRLPQKAEPTCGQCEYFTDSGCRIYRRPPLQPWGENANSCWRFKRRGKKGVST